MSRRIAIIVGAGPAGLTAAVDNILEGRTDKSSIWGVNTEQEHHETRD